MPVGYSNKTGLPLIPPSKKGVKMSEAQKRKTDREKIIKTSTKENKRIS